MGLVYGRMHLANVTQSSAAALQAASSLSDSSKSEPDYRGANKFKRYFSSFASSVSHSSAQLVPSGASGAANSRARLARAYTALLENRATLRRSARLGGSGAGSRSPGSRGAEIQSTLRRSARIAGVRTGPKRRRGAPSRARRSKATASDEQQQQQQQQRARFERDHTELRRSQRLQQRNTANSAVLAH